jgi:hypothetical protein
MSGLSDVIASKLDRAIEFTPTTHLNFHIAVLIFNPLSYTRDNTFNFGKSTQFESMEQGKQDAATLISAINATLQTPGQQAGEAAASTVRNLTF